MKLRGTLGDWERRNSRLAGESVSLGKYTLAVPKNLSAAAGEFEDGT
jgi:hypothetical protein